MTFILSFKTWGRIPKKQKSKTESRSTVVYSLNHRYPKIVLKSWALFNNEYEIQKRGFLFRVAYVMHSFFFESVTSPSVNLPNFFSIWLQFSTQSLRTKRLNLPLKCQMQLLISPNTNPWQNWLSHPKITKQLSRHRKAGKTSLPVKKQDLRVLTS